MNSIARKRGLLHGYRWLRHEADWKLAVKALVAFKKFDDEWDFEFTYFPFEDWVPAEVLAQVVPATPPTSKGPSPELDPNEPAISDDPRPYEPAKSVSSMRILPQCDKDD